MLFILMPTQKKIITTRNKKSHYVSLCAGSSSEFDDFGGNHWPGRFSERSRWNPVFLLRVWTLDQGMYVWIQKNTIGDGFFFHFPRHLQEPHSQSFNIEPMEPKNDKSDGHPKFRICSSVFCVILLLVSGCQTLGRYQWLMMVDGWSFGLFHTGI